MRLRRLFRELRGVSHHFCQVGRRGPGQPHVEMLEGEVRALRVQADHAGQRQALAACVGERVAQPQRLEGLLVRQGHPGVQLHTL